jgi:Flp pilus assembly protein TadB
MTAPGLLLVELRAALAAGAAPASALSESAARHPGLLPLVDHAARRLALGASIASVVASLPDAADQAAPLLRALALAERAGEGALAAVEQAETALRDDAELARRLRVRTAQARGSLRVLHAVPVAAVGLLALVEPASLGYYRQPYGRVTAAAAVLLALLARGWAGRIVDAVPRAARDADPLGAPPGDGAAETAELVAIGLSAGLSVEQALATLAELGPPAARSCLDTARRRLVAGWPVDEAFASGPLEPLGQALAAARRWGAPAEPSLLALAASLRSDRRAAAEEAAERAELRLVFPTTLLTLPSFLLAVVPPLVWTGLRW